MRFDNNTDWKQYKLKQLSKIYDGTHQTPDYKNEGIKFVSVEDINDLYATSKFITNEAFTRDFKVAPKQNDILMTRIGDIGSPTIVIKDEPLAYYVSLALIKPLDNLNSLFAKYMIESINFQHELWKRTIHVAFPKKINKEEIGECLCFVPELSVQQKIGSFLSLIDKRIETQNKIIEEKEKLIYAINDYLYDKSPKQEYKLLSLFEQYGGLSGKTADDFGKGMPYITFLSVLNDTYVTREHTQLVDIKKEEKQNIVGYEDVVLTLSSETPEEVGIVAVNLIAEPVYLNSFCMGLKIKNKNVVYNDYLTWLFSAKKFRKHIFPYAQGSTRFNLNVSSFMNSYFELPSLDNQIKITKMLNESLRELEIEKAILSKYILQRKYLLRNLFI